MSNENRKRLIAMINIAKQQLLMPDDCYRQNLYNLTGTTSLKQLTIKQLTLVLQFMKQKGFKPKPTRSVITQAQLRKMPQIAKLGQLWTALSKEGVFKSGSYYALQSWCANQHIAKQQNLKKLVAMEPIAYKLIEQLKQIALSRDIVIN